MMKQFIVILILPLVLIASCKGQTQVDPGPPPPMKESSGPKTRIISIPANPTIKIDTNSIRWTHRPIDTLRSKQGVNWVTVLENRNYASIAKSDHHFFSASTQSHYTNGKHTSSDLIIDVLDSKGNLLATKRKSNTEGHSLVNIITDDDHAYLMYQESLSSGDRDLYVAKIDTKANILWATRLGKRFGTFTSELLRFQPDGRLIAISRHYEPTFVEVLDPATGAILKSHRLDFPHEITVASFIINHHGHVVAIAREWYFTGQEEHHSILLFELDTMFNVIRQQYYKSELKDWAQGISQLSNENYIFLLKSEFESMNYKEEYELNIVGVTDQNFKLIDQQALEIEDDGMFSNIILSQDDLYVYQRSSHSFKLHLLNHKLQLQRTYTTKENYRSPGFITIGKTNKIWMGGHIPGSWLMELSIER